MNAMRNKPFEIYGTSAASHCQKRTSVYAFDGEFRSEPKHRFCLNQRHPCRFWKSSTYQNGHGCPWFKTVTSLLANWQPKNVQGCTFLGVLPLYFQLSPCIYTIYFQKAYGKAIFKNHSLIILRFWTSIGCCDCPSFKINCGKFF